MGQWTKDDKVANVEHHGPDASAYGFRHYKPGNHGDIVTQLKTSWEYELNRSRPFWQNSGEHSFPYNPNAPSIAYDPASIPSAHLGMFCHLKYLPPSEANNLAVSREHIESDRERGDLTHEFKNLLMDHPYRDDLLLIPNRWPRVSYHSLVVSRNVLPQKITALLALAEFYWADLGFVVEFHRFSRILDHFHFHIYPGSHAPIYQAKDSFVSEEIIDSFSVGELKTYPVPHVAISSHSAELFAGRIEEISDYLDNLRVPYGQVIMRAKSGSYVLLVFIREGPYFDRLSFGLIGLIRSPRDISDSEAMEFVTAIHRSGSELEKIKIELCSLLKREEKLGRVSEISEGTGLEA